MSTVRSDGSKGCRVRHNRGLRCALAALVLGLGAAQAYALCPEQQKLTAFDAAESDQFGFSVSVSGDTAVVWGGLGLCDGDIPCSTYVFRFNGTSWGEGQRLFDAAAGVGGTGPVSVSGDRVLAGDDVFRFNGTSWIAEQRLAARATSVALSGDTAVVGDSTEPFGDNRGSAEVFRFNGTSWGEQQRLTAFNPVARNAFGVSVSVSGDIILVGAYFDDCAAGARCGAAYVFRFDGTAWVEEQKLTAFDAAADDEFGVSVSLSGTTALVGAYFDDCAAGNNCGAAYVFRFNGTSWVEEQKLTASDAAAGDNFGVSVSVSGGTAVVGAIGDNCPAGTQCGSAYVFRFNGTSWIEERKLTASDAGPIDWFGHSVSVSGDTVVVGAPRNGCLAGQLCGSAYVFDCQPICGNGILQAGEACDGVDDAACPGACQTDCICGPFCGDGTCDPGEDSCSCLADCGIPPSSELPGSTCADGLDNDCDGFIDLDDSDCADEPIPTASQWGMILTTLLLLATAKIVFKRSARGTGTLGAMPKP